VGRISCSSRTTDYKEFRRRDGIVTKLADSSQIEVLRALKDGRITIEQLVEADREQRLKTSDLMGMLTLRRPLWTTITATLPAMGRSEATRKRYEVSLAALKTKGAAFLSEGSTVADLERVPWPELLANWKRSPSDRNHLRRAISSFLTTLLEDKFHPFRRSVIRRIPIAAEPARVPEITPEIFWKILKFVPKKRRACFITLLATGMRVGEYLRCTRFHLKPKTFSIAVPGTKTAGSAEDVSVHPSLWPYIEAAIPAPIGYKALRRFWKAACEKAKADVRMHDLRHAFGQWAVNAGVPEARVQSALRHRTAAMTRRYTLANEKGEAAAAVGEAILESQSHHAPAQFAAQGGKHGRA
jgi:integrase